MSKKPVVYGHCLAGCKWPVAHADDVAGLATMKLLAANDDGSYDLELKKRYRIFYDDYTKVEIVGKYIDGTVNKEGVLNWPSAWEEVIGELKACRYIDFEWVNLVTNTVDIVFFYTMFCDRLTYLNSTGFTIFEYDTNDGANENTVFLHVNGATKVYEFIDTTGDFGLLAEKVYIKYADDNVGTNLTPTYSGQKYIGVYTGQDDSLVPSDYTWLFVGGSSIWNLDVEGLAFDDLCNSEHWEKLNECNQLISNGQYLNKDSFTSDEIIFKRLDFSGTSLSVVVMRFSYYNGAVTPDIEVQNYNFAS